MPVQDYSVLLEEWQGFKVSKLVRIDVDGAGKRLIVSLEPDGAARCGSCGREVSRVHDVYRRRVSELPCFDCEVELDVAVRRVLCPFCGCRAEGVSWLGSYARHTNRLGESVARMCRFATVKDTAGFFRLDRKTVKAIDSEHLGRTLPPPDFGSVEVIAMDEFAIERGHKYATVVVEVSRRRVLWVGRGRDRASVHEFFKVFGEENCRRLKAVAMDMNASYDEEVREHCPNAKVVYDLFHVVAKYGREVVDRVRVDEADRLAGDKNARRVVKSSKWLLLSNRENIKPEAELKLKELLAANAALSTVYILKDDLKMLWSFRDVDNARNFWREWLNRAAESGVKPLKDFAKRLENYIGGILSHCVFPIGTSLLEGINNKIKVIKRRAYGFRDDHYFFLKIRQAFP